MMILAHIALLLFVAFVCVLIARHGIESCLSAYYYRMKHNYWFVSVMCAVGFLCIVTLVNVMPEHLKVLGFFTGAGICFVGAAPRYLSGGIDNKVHTIGAIISAAAAIATVCVSSWVILLPVAAIVLGLIIIRRKAWLLWLELACFIAAFEAMFRFISGN